MPKTRNVILLVLLGITAATVVPRVRERRERQRVDAQAATRQLLDARVAPVGRRYGREAQLAEVMRSLQAQSGLPLNMDWQRLREQGVNPEVRLSVELVGLRLSQALDEVLESAARNASTPGSPATRLAYSVGPGGEVTIRPEQEIAAETSVFEVYDVRRIFGSEWLRRPHASPAARLVENVVMDGVSPTSWRDNWRYAVCRYRDGRVLVLQTPERHREVGQCLAGLRQAMYPDAEMSRLLRRLRGEEPR